MIRIDSKLCTGCGACARDCMRSIIGMEGGRPQPDNEKCVDCGHCAAVCPVGAVSLIGYEEGEVLEYTDIRTDIDPEVYLNHLKARRSIRHFTDKAVNEKELAMILEAGRFSPTGGNRQDVSYTVFQKELPKLRERVMKTLYDMGAEAALTGNKISWYSDLWIEMYEEFKKTGIDDSLYFGAGTVIVISAEQPSSALIAAAHMETMVYSLGLGMVYSGFTLRAMNGSEELKKYVACPPGKDAAVVLVIGEPDVRYFRTVPRKKADVALR